MQTCAHNILNGTRGDGCSHTHRAMKTPNQPHVLGACLHASDMVFRQVEDLDTVPLRFAAGTRILPADGTRKIGRRCDMQQGAQCRGDRSSMWQKVTPRRGRDYTASSLCNTDCRLHYGKEANNHADYCQTTKNWNASTHRTKCRHTNNWPQTPTGRGGKNWSARKRVTRSIRIKI